MSNKNLFVALPRGVTISEVEELLSIDLCGSDYNKADANASLFGPLGILTILPVMKDNALIYQMLGRPLFFDPYPINDWGLIIMFRNSEFWNDVRNAVALSFFWHFYTKGSKSLLSWWMGGSCFFYSRADKLFLSNRVKGYMFCMNKYDPSVDVQWKDLPNVGGAFETAPSL